MGAIGASSGVLKSTSTSASIGDGNSKKWSVPSVSPWKVSVRNRRHIHHGNRWRTWSFSLSSSMFPTTIEIPEVKFYPSEHQSFLSNEEDEEGRTLKRVVIRMSIRDDDGVLAQKLAPFWEAFLKMPRGVDMILRYYETTETLTYLSQGVSGCLLEHVDSWICGYSLVTYKDFGAEFNKELDKLDPIVNLFAGKGKNGPSKVRTVELNLRMGVYGKIFDRDIRTRDDLIDVLEQLNSRYLEGKQEDMLLCFLPAYLCRRYSKEKVDQINGYAHLCLGKFQ